MIGIVVSDADEASAHIGEQLLALESWSERTDESRAPAAGGGTVYHREGFELRRFDELHLEIESAAAAFEEPDLVVFASRHAGDTGALLTAHHTGNFGPAEYGGKDRAFARACPNAHSHVIDRLAAHAPEGYEVGMECTHHGPSEVGVPSMFVELGSEEAHWADESAARAVARAILDLQDVPADRDQQLVGFGGGHYAPRFERIVRETEWAVGHVGADWCLEELGDPTEHADVVESVFEQSDADIAVVDGEHPELRATIEDLGYRVVGETWLRTVDGVDPGLRERVIDATGSVDAGLRFGPRAREYTGAIVVIELPEKLLDTVQGIDREAARDAIEARALAYETAEAGNRLTGTVALPTDVSRAAIIESLLPVLRDNYDAVEVTTDAIVVEEYTFDPSKARTLGVQEGPKFGALASGETIEVDGRTIEPDAVRTTERTTLPR